MTPVTERALNVAPGDIGRPIGDLRLSIEIPELEALLREVIETLTVQEREVRPGTGAGTRCGSGRTGPADNRIEGAVISFVDIDALKRGLEQAKEARDHAEAIVATVREPLVILDADLRVVTANRSFYETFQVTPDGDGAPDPSSTSGTASGTFPRLRTLLEEILPRDSVVEDFEVEHDFESIGRRTMLLNARRVLSATGEPALILLAIEDITEAKRTGGRRERRSRAGSRPRATEAEAANRAKDRFLAILSHELRTPLNAMLGWTRMLRTEKLDQAATAAGHRGDRAQHRAAGAAHRGPPRRVAHRRGQACASTPARSMLAPVVEAAIDAVRPAAEAKGIRLESQLDPAAGPVRATRRASSRSSGTCCRTRSSSRRSGGRVDVRLARRGPEVEISVRDTGQGIAAEQLPHVFDRFGIAAHQPTQTHGGLGLGLAIVRHLVELHGGTVRAESAGPGRGATFTVTLPAPG